MTDDQRNAQVVLTADTTNYQQGMAAASSTTDRATASVGKLLAAVNQLTVSAGKKLIGIGAVEMAGLIGVTTAAARLEHQMDQLKASSVITGRNFENFSKSVGTLRTQMGLSTSEAVALVTQLNNLGQNNQNIQSLSQTFVRLGTVTGEAIGGLVDGLISLQRQMGTEGATATEHFASSLALLSQRTGVSATSVLQFANAIAPIAKVAGVTQTELMGISTAFAKVGQDGYAATNTFNKFLTGITSAIQNGSPDLSAYANLIGKTVEEFKGMNKADAITQIFSEINREGPNAIKTLERFGLDGVKSYKAIQALAASGGLQDSISTAMEGQKDTTKFLSASDEALNGLTENLKKLGETLQSIGESFGAGLVRPASAAISVLTGLVAPINALMSSLGNIPAVAGVAMAGVTLLAGAALRSFGVMTALAGFQTIRRNSFGSGFRQGAGSEQNFQDPMYAARIKEGTANPIMRGMYGTGQFMGRNFGGVRNAYTESVAKFYTDRNMPIPEHISALSRANGMGGAAIGQVGNFLRGGLTPLYPSAVWDSTSRERIFGGQVQAYSPAQRLRMGLSAGQEMLPGMEGTGAAGAPLSRMGRYRTNLADWGSHFGGTPLAEGGTTGGIPETSNKFGSALKSATNFVFHHGEEVNKSTGVFKALRNETGSLIGSIAKAGIGGGAVIGGAAVKGVGGIASGAMNLVGGPIGVAAIGGIALYEGNKSKNDVLDKIAHNTEDLSASSTYRSALNEASTGVMDFATATKTAAALIKQATGKDMSKEQAVTLSASEIKAADKGNYTDKRIADMNKEQAQSFASVALANASPKDARLLALDMAKRFGNDSNDIMNGAYKGTPDVAGLFGNIEAQGSSNPIGPWANNSGMEEAGKLASSSAQSLLKQAPIGKEDSVKLGITTGALQAYMTNSRDIGNMNSRGGNASSTTAAGITDALANTFGSTSEQDRKEVRDAAEKFAQQTIGNMKLDASGNYASVGSDAKANLKPFLQELARNGSSGVGAQARSMLEAMNQTGSPGFQANSDPADFMATVNAGVLARGRTTAVGANALSYSTTSGQTVSSAVANTQDIFKQNAGANAMLASANGLGQGMQGSLNALANFKRGIVDATDPLFQLATAAEQAIKGQQERQEAYQTTGTTAGVRVASYLSDKAQIAAGDTSADALTKLKTDAASVQQMISSANQQFRAIVTAKRNYDTQTSRSEYDYGLQRSRSQTAFSLQNSYSLHDFTRQRQVSDTAFSLSRTNAQRDYGVQLRESWYQYNLSRTRAEVEFNHQVVMMAKASAKSVYDVYSRVKIEQTWSAQSLIANMTDQQRRLNEQQANLAQVRKMGLSGDVIDQLGLNDPSKAQQLARILDELINNPKMIDTFNKGITSRIDAAGKVVTDKDNTAWTEMLRSYKLNMDNGQTDFLHGLNVQNAAFSVSMEDQRKAYQVSIDLSIENFNLNRDRQLAGFNLGMSNMAKDHNEVMARAKTDFSIAYEEITAGFNTMGVAAVAALTGTAKTQAQALLDVLGPMVADIEATLASVGIDTAPTPQQTRAGYAAKLKAQGFSTGGEIMGSSPHPKADNILIKATAGEYVQPVDTVQHYGVDFMDRLRRRQVRKDELNGYASGGMIWPTNTHQISPSYPGHSGIDIAARMGAPIYAPMDGSIFYSGWDRGYGQAIFERFNAGLEAVFGHTSQVIAGIGPVIAGQLIGLVGSTGHSTGPHLHFEINSPGPFGNAADRDPSMKFLSGLSDGTAAMMSAGTGQTAQITPDQFETIVANLATVKKFADIIGGTPGLGTRVPADLIPSRLRKKYAAQLGQITGPNTAGSANAQANQVIAEGLLNNYGWGMDQMPALTQLWNNESGWDQHAKNPSSGAYGIAQSLPASKMGSVAADWMDNPETQIRWGMGYIKDRYGSPSAAMSKWNVQHWYGEGGMFNGKHVIGVGEHGPEAVLPLNEKGASFLSNVMGQMSNAESRKAMLQAGGTTTKASTVTYYQHVDKSTTFSGAISVTANDPNEFIRTLEARQRMKALTGR